VYDPQRALKSDILTKIRSRKRAKELELYIFDIAQNQRDYSTKIRQLIKFIHKNGNMVFKPIDQLIVPRSAEKNYELTFDEVKVLLSQESAKLKILQDKIRALKAKNFQEQYIVYWNPPPIVTEAERKEWDTTFQKLI
jgi:hypothetical protein